MSSPPVRVTATRHPGGTDLSARGVTRREPKTTVATCSSTTANLTLCPGCVDTSPPPASMCEPGGPAEPHPRPPATPRNVTAPHHPIVPVFRFGITSTT
jgi:hypothetical protein